MAGCRQLMSGPGVWLAERRTLRILFTAILFPLGLLSIVSAAAIVLTAILHGWRTAVEDSLAALLLLLGLVVLVGGSVQALVISAVLVWGMAIVLGGLAGRYASITLPIQVLTLVAAAGVLVFAVVVTDPIAFWQPVMAQIVAQLKEFGLEAGNPDALKPLSPLLAGMVAASMVISSVLALLLGAWWASAAGGPGFARMFLQLRLGVVLGVAAAVAGLAAGLGMGWIASSLVLVFGTVFALQGLAVLHWQARAHGWGWPVLLAVYAPLFFGPMVASVAWLLWAMVGFIDNSFGLRRDGADVIK